MPTILVADDNSNIQKMVSLVFKEKGIRVVAVGNGEAACRKVPEVRPDVVLADVFMPVRNGYEVCEFVKHDPQFAETPVVLLVGAFDPLDEKEAQRVGANGVLKKPFVPPEPLIAMVNSLLGKTEAPVEETQPAAEAVKIELPPPPEPAPRPAPQEFAFGSSDENDEAVSAYGEPVATPSAESSEPAEEEYPEQESEWTRRRAACDYEIDTADSANLVEKLAAEGVAEESEIHATNKHLPFGGANVPEAISGAFSESNSSRRSSLKAPETTAKPASEQQEHVVLPEEPPALICEERTAPDFLLTPSDADMDSPSDGQITLPPLAIDTALADEPAHATSGASAMDAALIQESPVIPNDAIRESAPMSWPSPSDTTLSSPEPISTSIQKSKAQASLHEVTEKISETLALPETTIYGASGDAHGSPLESAGPVSSNAASKPDQATIDDVVAKVLSKLEPQLHEALANGVLRPLVEELLNQQRDKK